MSEKEDTNYQSDERLLSAHVRLEKSEQATFGANDSTDTDPRPSRLRQRLANPDDPPVRRPPQGPKGPLPAPNYLGIPGRIAIVQGQIFIVAAIMIAQLWLITYALYALLSGHSSILGWLALASALGFVLAFIVSFWPRRRVEGS